MGILLFPSIESFEILATLGFRGCMMNLPTRTMIALLKQVVCVPGRNSQIRPVKVFDYREIDSNHFSVPVEQRPARTTRCRSSIVNDLVLQNVPYVPLRGGQPDEPL